MEHTEINTMDENKLNPIRKKSSFLRDSSYRIFHITKKANDNSDDEQTINAKKSQRKISKTTNRNGLKNFLCRHKSAQQSIELSQSIICIKNQPPIKRLNMDETIVDNVFIVRTNKLPLDQRKKMLLANYRERQVSFDRRRKRFIVACSTVVIALTIIIIIMIYVVIMTIKHRTQMKQFDFYH